MNLNLKLNFKSTTNSSMKNVGSLILRVWKKIHTLLFFLILLASIAVGGYLWQRNINSGGWSSEKKQEYMNTQNKEVIFKEKDFQKVLDDITLRKEESSKEYQPIKNIFKPY